MSYYLKIYDFLIFNKTKNSNTTYYHLALNHTELSAIVQSKVEEINENIDRQIVFDSYLRKLQTDLNIETIKDIRTKKIIKKSKKKIGDTITTFDILKDYENKLIYGVLHGGKITENSMLESRKVIQEKGEDEYDYNVLNGDRIYDEFFFMLHISFKCNISRLFILSKKETTITDGLFKKYLKGNLFKATQFKETKVVDFIADEYRQIVLDRVVINNVYISNSQRIISEGDNMEYDVEIKLKPRNQSTLASLSAATLNFFKKSKVEISDSTSEDENSIVKFKIKDPITGTEKTISYNDRDAFIPRLELENEQVLDQNNMISVLKMKDICLPYIKYNDNNLIV
jgi:hypothetical protein